MAASPRRFEMSRWRKKSELPGGDRWIVGAARFSWSMLRECARAFATCTRRRDTLTQMGCLAAEGPDHRQSGEFPWRPSRDYFSPAFRSSGPHQIWLDFCQSLHDFGFGVRAAHPGARARAQDNDAAIDPMIASARASAVRSTPADTAKRSTGADADTGP
jgi:hypothetical protein